MNGPIDLLRLVPNQVLYFIQTSLLIDEGASVQEIGTKNNWTMPLISYLKNGMLLDGKDAARKLKVQASRFVIIMDVLYREAFPAHI